MRRILALTASLGLLVTAPIPATAAQAQAGDPMPATRCANGYISKIATTAAQVPSNRGFPFTEITIDQTGFTQGSTNPGASITVTIAYSSDTTGEFKWNEVTRVIHEAFLSRSPIQILAQRQCEAFIPRDIKAIICANEADCGGVGPSNAALGRNEELEID